MQWCSFKTHVCFRSVLVHAALGRWGIHACAVEDISSLGFGVQLFPRSFLRVARCAPKLRFGMHVVLCWDFLHRCSFIQLGFKFLPICSYCISGRAFQTRWGKSALWDHNRHNVSMTSIFEGTNKGKLIYFGVKLGGGDHGVVYYGLNESDTLLEIVWKHRSLNESLSYFEQTEADGIVSCTAWRVFLIW